MDGGTLGLTPKAHRFFFFLSFFLRSYGSIPTRDAHRCWLLLNRCSATMGSVVNWLVLPFAPNPFSQEDHFDTNQHFHHVVLRDLTTGKEHFVAGLDDSQQYHGEMVEWVVQDVPIAAPAITKKGAALPAASQDKAHGAGHVAGGVPPPFRCVALALTATKFNPQTKLAESRGGAGLSHNPFHPANPHHAALYVQANKMCGMCCACHARESTPNSRVIACWAPVTFAPTG
jgi:hypothetical protein